MTPSILSKANEFLATWDGSVVEFNSFTCIHSRFVLAIDSSPIGKTFGDASVPQGNPATFGKSFGISFTPLLYISGATSWSNCVLRCQVGQHDGHDCYEVYDKIAGFVLRCGAIIVGDGYRIWGSE